MTAALDELKIRARVRLTRERRAGGAVTEATAGRAQDPAQRAPRLRDGLHEAAREVGFQHWDHARRVLGGQAAPGDDHGAFWHAPRCDTLLNLWFADLARAREGWQAAGARAVLLPFRRQFVVVQAPYLRELGLDPADPLWEQAGRDLVAAYGSPAWAALCLARLRAADARFG